MKDLLDWFILFCSRGPAFGYFPQPSKCFVVVAPSFVDQEKKTILDVWVFRLLNNWVSLFG